LTTLPHLSVSCAMNLPKSAGELDRIIIGAKVSRCRP
jgi:hypothetical protein